MATKHKEPDAGNWNRPFTLIGQILFWAFWMPILFIIIAPWLSLAVVHYLIDPLFPEFFQALASTGWLVVSVLLLAWVGGDALLSATRRRRSRNSSPLHSQ